MDIYDYIIVGAGSSGCVVAARLSEDANVRVLLIEAGPPSDSFWMSTPAGVGKLFHDPTINWRDTTEAVPTLGGRTIYWPRGKTLGGSSAINGMVYRRGHPHDFDSWAQLGNEGWSWKDVLPYFKRSESNEGGATALRGDSGPLTVTNPAVRHRVTDAFLDAANRNGIPRVKDLNDASHEGAAYQQFTIKNGRRHSVYKAYIEPVLHRKNLHVITNTQALRIVIEQGEAVGVEVLQTEQRRIIYASREVIVSAGSLNSPHLLMLSGVGPREMLQRHNIKTIVDAPGVGRNLQDHWFAPFQWQTTTEGSFNGRLHGWRKYLEGARYVLTRGGYFAVGSSAASAYFRSDYRLPSPDLQFAMRPVTFQFDTSGNAVIDSVPGIMIAVVLSLPRSKGHIELTSHDPLRRPAFHPNYLSDPDDVRRTLCGIQLLRKIAQTEPLASLLVSEQLPNRTAKTEEQLIEHIKANGSCAWHQVGSCRMGNDTHAVVDSRLRVHGIRRLRVIDASIMPNITSGNTNAPAIMIGEKGADMIVEDAQRLGTRSCKSASAA